MPKPTRVYGRWERGLVYAGDDRSWEMFLDLGGVRTEEAAKGICRSVLAGLTGAAEQGSTMSGDAATMSGLPTLGSSIAGGGVVTGINASLTDDGADVTVTMTALDTFRLEAEAKKLQRAAAGIQSQWAAPIYERLTLGTRQDTTPPEFSFDGRVKVRYSPIWPCPKNWWFSWAEINVVEAGWLPTTFKVGKVFQPGGAVVPMVTVILEAGSKQRIVKLPNTPSGAGVQAGEQLVAWCSKAGGCAQATLSLHGAMV